MFVVVRAGVDGDGGGGGRHGDGDDGGGGRCKWEERTYVVAMETKDGSALVLVDVLVFAQA